MSLFVPLLDGIEQVTLLGGATEEVVVGLELR